MAKHPKTHPTLEDAHTGRGPLGYWGEWVSYCPDCAVKLFGPPSYQRPVSLEDATIIEAERYNALAVSGGKDSADTIRAFWPADIADEEDVELCDECLARIYDHVADWSKR